MVLNLKDLIWRKYLKIRTVRFCSSSNEDIPKESYAEQLEKTDGKPVSTYVPFRNGLFLSCAASVALSNGCTEIYYGVHSDDAAGNAYPDCSIDFNNAINSAVYIGSGHQLVVTAPFISLNKAQVIAKGLSLKVPYEMTWSCYEGGDRPCGKCGTCRDRIAAFRANGINDPLKICEDELERMKMKRAVLLFWETKIQNIRMTIHPKYWKHSLTSIQKMIIL